MENFNKILPMALFFRIISLVLLAVVVFGRNLFPSELLYWSTYAVIALTITLMWFSMFWVSKKRVKKILGKAPEFDIFTGKVPSDSTMDLIRGRLCVSDGKATLIHKNGSRYETVYEVSIDKISSVTYGKVAGIRNGFTIYAETGDIQFVCASSEKKKDLINKALGL